MDTPLPVAIGFWSVKLGRVTTRSSARGVEDLLISPTLPNLGLLIIEPLLSLLSGEFVLTISLNTISPVDGGGFGRLVRSSGGVGCAELELEPSKCCDVDVNRRSFFENSRESASAADIAN